jgi:uncharacterized membrane protein YoaK (UPF0700 family)
MTGNTVLLGAALSQGHVARVLGPVVAIGCYVCGVFGGTALLETVFARWADATRGQVWPRAISWVLGIESALMIGAAVAWGCFGSGDAVLRYALVAVAAVALGLQSAAMQSLQLPGIVTTYITGTWTTLVAGVARVVTGGKRVDVPHAQLKMQGAVLVAYCASAAVSGVLFRWWAAGVGVLPAAAVSFVAVYGVWSGPGDGGGVKV